VSLDVKRVAPVVKSQRSLVPEWAAVRTQRPIVGIPSHVITALPVIVFGDVVTITSVA
jgi:hypothetical protein